MQADSVWNDREEMNMSQLMEQAFLKARQLPESDQEAIASIILQEIESDSRWEELFARPDSAELLSHMADEAMMAAVAQGVTYVFPFRTDSLPFRTDQGGVVRLGNSRISLDLVVEQYDNGMSPEDMVRAYDTLVLADVHAVIAYYLRHHDEVRAYLKRREIEAEAVRTKIETERPRVSREELLARRGVMEEADAPAGQ